MTADPDSPPEPRLEPAGSGTPNDKPARPKPPVIEQRPLPQTGGNSGGGILRPLAAGVIGGLVGATIVYLALPGGSGADADARQAIKALQDQTAELNDAVRSKAATAVAPSAASSEEVNEVRSRLDGLLQAEKGLDDTVQALSQRVQTVEQKPAPEPAKDAIQAAIASQITPLTERLTSIEHTQTERQSDARTAALTLALTNLKRAVSEGKPFPAELAAVENLSSTKLPISDLAAYKDTGVFSLAELQRDFNELARNVIQKHYHNKADFIVSEVLSRARAAI